MYREEIFRFQGAGAVLHGFLQRPCAEHAVACLLVCPPLFEERKACNRALVELGRKLAEADWVCLRFDYGGTGDAAGDSSRAAVENWLEDVRSAAGWLAAACPSLPLFLLGVRGSAALALQAAAGGLPLLRGAVLWEPLSGADLLRQLLQRRMVNDMLAYGRPRTGRKQWEDEVGHGATGDLEGYPVAPALHAGLRRLELCPSDRPLLALSAAADPHGLSSWASACAALEHRVIRLPPFWNTVGHMDTDAWQTATREWLVQQAGGTAAGAVLQLPASVASDEEPVAVRSGEETVRGVLHRASPAATGQPVLLLAGWSGDRAGPHRVFVDLSRRLAAAGHPALRIDYRGRGESDGGHASASIASMTADAAAAAAWLRQRFGDRQGLIVLAICSGCKVAVSLAAADPGVGRLVLWSAESMGSLRAGDTGRRKRWTAAKGYALKLTRLETWRKLLTGRVQTQLVGRALAAGHEVRSPGEARREDEVLRQFRTYRGDILFVFGGSDPDAVGSRTAYERFCRRHGISFDTLVIPHAGHSYYGGDWRRQLMEATLARLSVKAEA